MKSARQYLAFLTIFLVSGCSTISTLHGAKTLHEGEYTLSAAASGQVGSNPIATVGFPIPQTEIALRYGMKENMDLGMRAYIGGIAFDTRYRLYHDDRLHFAVDPGVAGIGLPFVPNISLSSLEGRLPILAEWEISPKLSIMGGSQMILRRYLIAMDSDLGAGDVQRLDTFIGGGARIEYHPARFRVGLSTDILAQPTRHSGPAWSFGLDFGFLGNPNPAYSKP